MANENFVQIVSINVFRALELICSNTIQMKKKHCSQNITGIRHKKYVKNMISNKKKTNEKVNERK